MSPLQMQKLAASPKSTSIYLSPITVAGKTILIGATPDGQVVTVIPTPASERVYGKASFGSSFKMTFTQAKK